MIVGYADLLVIVAVKGMLLSDDILSLLLKLSSLLKNDDSLFSWLILNNATSSLDIMEELFLALLTRTLA
jgi:hypothetical protein